MSTSERDLLDDLEELQRLDKSGIFELVANLPEQIEEGLATKSAGSWPREEFQQVVVCGMGGSAIGADLASAMAGGELKVPFQVYRNYELPAHADKQCLVILSSYSGNTEETLSALAKARENSNQIVCLTSGGALLRRAREEGLAFFELPAGFPPRAALGYSATLLLRVLEQSGITPTLTPRLKEIIPWLKKRAMRLHPEVPCSSNPAKQLALEFQGKTPVFYGTAGGMEIVSRRWAGQFCENAKQLAFSGPLPEMLHNEIVGWTGRTADHLFPVFLRDDADDHRVQSKIEAALRELAAADVSALELWTEGTSSLARLWGLILLGDFVSLYAAALNGVDPAPVDVIDRLKS